jgi:hypothetical protein
VNPQIEKLAKLAGWDNHHTQSDTRIEKFAQLIIAECLNQCYFRGMSDELYVGQLRAAAYIEEYFEVEQ